VKLSSNLPRLLATAALFLSVLSCSENLDSSGVCSVLCPVIGGDVKNITIDAVVVGYRPGKEEGTVGSLILGLYDPAGKLHVVGHSSGLRAAEKRALVERLEPYETGKRGHGDPSRWKSEKDLEWIELRPELVVEVTFDHASGGRIRHGTKILRWRDDKAPEACALSQMDA